MTRGEWFTYKFFITFDDTFESLIVVSIKPHLTSTEYQTKQTTILQFKLAKGIVRKSTLIQNVVSIITLMSS